MSEPYMPPYWLDLLKPLNKDMIIKDNNRYNILSRTQDRGIIFIDEFMQPHLIYGEVPYHIRIGHEQHHKSVFFAVKYPVRQNPKSNFCVTLDRPFNVDNNCSKREVEMVKFYYNIPQDNPETDQDEEVNYNNILKEAITNLKQYDKDPRSDRSDCRDKCTFTIDGKRTKVIDDAIEVQKLGDNKYLLGIHIADVSEYIKNDSKQDSEAFKRGISYYLADQVVHMLPQCLSENICSLIQKKDRLTLSLYTVVEFNNGRYNFKDIMFSKSAICSKANLTYSEVNGLLNRGKFDNIDDKVKEAIRFTNELARKIQISGQIESHYLTKLASDVNLYDTDTKAKSLVEKFMIIANSIAGKRIANLITSTNSNPQGIGVYRSQFPPKDLKVFLKKFIDKLDKHKLLKDYGGLKNELDNISEPTPIYVWRDIADKIFYSIIKPVPNEKERILEAVLDEYKKYIPFACLSDNIKKSDHFSIGIDCYALFTSPIRRYCDIVNHRLIKTPGNSQIIKNNFDINELDKCFRKADSSQKDLKKRLSLYRLHKSLPPSTIEARIKHLHFIRENTIRITTRWSNEYIDFEIKNKTIESVNENNRYGYKIDNQCYYKGDSINITYSQQSEIPEKGFILIDKIEKTS